MNPIDGNSVEVDVKEIWKVTEMMEITYFLTHDGHKIIPMFSRDKKRIFLNSEIPNDRMGRLRYSKVRFYSRNKYHERSRAINAVNKLIEYYGIITGSYTIHRVTEEDIMIFESRHNGVSSIETAKILSQFNKDIGTSTVEDLREFLMNDVPIAPHYSLRFEAKKAFYEGNYFLSAILSGTAIEALVKYYLIVKPISIPNSEIKRIANDLSFDYLIGTKLRPQLDKRSSTDDILKDLSLAYRKRNDVLHNYKLETTKEEAMRNIEVLDKALRVLG